MRDPTDPFDPITRSYRRLWLKAKCGLVLLACLVAAMLLIGVPHVQVEYTTTGPRRSGFTPSQDKRDAWYLGATGWRHLSSSELDHQGLPIVVWLPADECFEATWRFPFLTPKE